MTVSRFRVAAMDCAAEEQLVRMALADLDAIDHLHFDLTQREVFIDHQTDPAIIDSALQRLNLGARHLDNISEIQDPSDSGSGSERNATH